MTPMPKPLIILLVGLGAYAIQVAALYWISVPVLQIEVVKKIPQLAGLFWLVILGCPAMLTAGVLRELYDIMYERRGRRRR